MNKNESGRRRLVQIARCDAQPCTNRERSVSRFILFFLILLAAFYACTTISFLNTWAIPGYMRWIANTSSNVLQLFGEDTQVSGILIFGPRFTVRIGHGCDGIEPTAIYVAAILASPLTISARIIGAAVGVFLLILVNLIRIVTLYLTGAYLPSYFDMVHIDVWQTLFVFVTLMLWMAWAIWALRRGVRRVAAPA